MAKKKLSDTQEEALKKALEKIEKDFGKGTVMPIDSKAIQDIEVIPTGSIGLDEATGIGGYPRGRVVEVYGAEAGGKTTSTIHAMIENQKLGGKSLFIDAEHAFDRYYAQNIGLKLDKSVHISQPDSGEEALEIADLLIASGAFSLVIIDSVAALTPRAEIEGEMGDNRMGLHARLMSQALRKLTAVVSRTNTCCIFINQLRSKIGVTYGSPEVTTGGNALKFYASMRVDVRRVTTLKYNKDDKDDMGYGIRTRAKIVKNKLAAPFKRAEFDILFGEGFSRAGEVVDIGVKAGIIKKAGSWFSYEGTQLGQGRDAVVSILRDNEELMKEIEGKL